MRTSIEALIRISDIRNPLCRAIFRLIKKNGVDGHTCDELEDLLALKHQTASARVNDLYRQGWIYRTTQRRLTKSGSKAAVYRARRVQQPRVVTRCPTCGHRS